MSDEPTVEAVPLFKLPGLNRPFEGGVFCGVTTLPDGKHVAIVKLADEPDQPLMGWKQAIAWVKRVRGQLPTPAIAAQLSFLANGHLKRTIYWTSEPRNSYESWTYDFKRCTLETSGVLGEHSAFAIRLIPLAEPVEAYELEMRVRAIEAHVDTAQLKERVTSLESRLSLGH